MSGGNAGMKRMTRACLKCEGHGVRRDYLNRAGDYTTYHCTECHGTGREQTTPDPNVLAFVEARANGWERVHLTQLTSELLKAIQLAGTDSPLTRDHLDKSIRLLLRDECRAIAGYIKQPRG